MIENNAMQSLPPYLFARIEKKIEEAREKGIDIINLGIGDPDQPTPKHIIDRMAEAIYEAANHQYPLQLSLSYLRPWPIGIETLQRGFGCQDRGGITPGV